MCLFAFFDQHQEIEQVQAGKALEMEDDNATGSASKKARVCQSLAELATAMRPLLTGRLRRTTLLLMFIWFVNALCYYGLVLLTTTVRALCPACVLPVWC
jgi:hypothetical protein